jgi:hypothetical protein
LGDVIIARQRGLFWLHLFLTVINYPYSDHPFFCIFVADLVKLDVLDIDFLNLAVEFEGRALEIIQRHR